MIRINQLTKSYDATRALDNVTLNIARNEVVSIIGYSGSGKSTLIKLIAGLLQPDSGEILVDGHPIGAESNALISYLPERPYFSTNMKVEQLLHFFRDFYGDFDIDRAYQLLADLKIDPKAQLKTLSKGTKEKVQLIFKSHATYNYKIEW